MASRGKELKAAMNTLGCVVCALLALLLAQQLCVFLLFQGQFIHSAEDVVIFFNFCLRGQDGGMICSDRALRGLNAAVMNIQQARMVVALCLFTPLVLVPFAFLALLFGVVCEDGGVLGLSMVCQAAASSLTFLGLCVFTGVQWAWVTLEVLTAGFHLSVAVGVQLALSAGMTWRLWKTDRMYNTECEKQVDIDRIM